MSETSPNPLPCGCAILGKPHMDDFGNSFTYKDIRIKYCPTHKAAPDLLEACKLLTRELQIFQAASSLLKNKELNSIKMGIEAIRKADGTILADCTNPPAKAEGK